MLVVQDQVGRESEGVQGLTRLWEVLYQSHQLEVVAVDQVDPDRVGQRHDMAVTEVRAVAVEKEIHHRLIRGEQELRAKDMQVVKGLMDLRGVAVAEEEQVRWERHMLRAMVVMVHHLQ